MMNSTLRRAICAFALVVMVGLRTGATVVMPHGPRPGIGADINRSWRFGRHLYVSPGVGVKTVLGMPEDANLCLSPTVRLNLGIAY